jgi:hypothetical protein
LQPYWGEHLYAHLYQKLVKLGILMTGILLTDSALLQCLMYKVAFSIAGGGLL